MTFKMNRLRTALFLLGCFFLFSAYAEDTGSSGAQAGGGQGGGQDTTGGAAGGQGQGMAGGGQAAAAPAAPVVLPGAYGSAPISVTPGEGRFAKPPYSFTLTLQQGYDSNVFTTEKNQVSSLENTGQLAFQMQGASPRTIFTLDSTAGLSYFWNRPGKSEDYNGNISLLFFHRITSRMNISATVSVGYLSQPNFAAMNASTNQQAGNYILANSRLNLSYQWSAKVQTNTSYSINSTLYQEKKQQTSNIIENTFGNEFRFLLNPRTSLVAEGRLTLDSYPKMPTGDSTTLYGLLGADYVLSSRLSATARGGLQYRTYSTPGSSGGGSSSQSQSSPYAETTMTYIYGHQSNFQWTNRFGLDSSNVASQKVTSFRTGVNFNHVLTAKTTLTLGLNYNIQNTQTGSTPSFGEIVTVPPIFGPISIPGSTTVQYQINSVLGLQYMLTPKFSLTASYIFTDVISAVQFNSSYTRNQIFFGGTYTF